MNLDDLGAQLQAHKGPLLAAGAAGVAGLAYYRKKKTAAAGGGTSAASSASAGGQTATAAGMNATAPYDSSSSDVYGLLQPQLESLGGQLTDLQARMNAVPVSTAPDTATTAPAPVGSTVNAAPAYGTHPYGPGPDATPVPVASIKGAPPADTPIDLGGWGTAYFASTPLNMAAGQFHIQPNGSYLNDLTGVTMTTGANGQPVYTQGTPQR